MNIKLSEVASEAEFDNIWPVHFEAFQNPYNAFSKFFNPIHTTFDAAIEASKVRHIRLWKGNPSCHWIKAVEVQSGKILGAACWGFNLEVHALSEGKRPLNAYWHIEGSDEKLFAEKLIGGLKGFVAQRITYPHLELNKMVVGPDHRFRGVGKMLIDWGIRKADELGMEIIVESVPFAVPFYEKCGFGCVERIDIDFSVRTPSKNWEEYQSEDLKAFLMWRPAGRSYEHGDKLPWRS